MLTTLSLAALALQDPAAGSLGPGAPKARGPAFAPPVEVVAADGPINGDDAMLYPSPVVFDVDGDGAAELVLGDLFGNLFVHQPVATEDGRVAWGPRERLVGADGSNIELPNW